MEGVPVIGQALTAKVTPPQATVTYQWQRADAADGTFENITGATNSTYKLTDADKGKWIRVTATGTGKYRGTVESDPVGPVEWPVLNQTKNIRYPNILGAIEEADEGNTIVVAAGTFAESLPISKSLTILGVNADNDARTDDFLDEGTVVTGGIRITGGDVTLKGLTIKNKGILASDITELKLINNKILDITEVQEGAEDGSIIGLDVASASGSITVDTNVFSAIGEIDSTGTAIRIVEAADSITITDNIIKDVTKNGINIYRNCLTQQSAVLTIRGNVIKSWDSDTDEADIGGRAIRIDFAGAHNSARAEITENKLIPPVYGSDQTPVDPQYVKLTSVDIEVDLTKNYWGSPTPDFETILLIEGDKAEDCKYMPYYSDETMTSLEMQKELGLLTNYWIHELHFWVEDNTFAKAPYGFHLPGELKEEYEWWNADSWVCLVSENKKYAQAKGDPVWPPGMSVINELGEVGRFHWKMCFPYIDNDFTVCIGTLGSSPEPYGKLNCGSLFDPEGKQLLAATYCAKTGEWFTDKKVDYDSERFPILGLMDDKEAPTLVSLTAYLSDETSREADSNWTLTWTVGETVDHIEAVASEPVRLAVDKSEAVVTMSGDGISEGAVYGTIAIYPEDPTKIIITPNPGNETAGLAGTFTFTVAAGVIEDLAGNKNAAVNITLNVQPDQEATEATQMMQFTPEDPVEEEPIEPEAATEETESDEVTDEQTTDEPVGAETEGDGEEEPVEDPSEEIQE